MTHGRLIEADLWPRVLARVGSCGYEKALLLRRRTLVQTTSHPAREEQSGAVVNLAQLASRCPGQSRVLPHHSPAGTKRRGNPVDSVPRGPLTVSFTA